MAEKKTYTVYRAMHGDGRDYARGDTREMTETDAASLVASGALALEGEVPLERGAAVQHAFGSIASDSTYTDASESVHVSDSRVEGRRNPAKRG